MATAPLASFTVEPVEPAAPRANGHLARRECGALGQSPTSSPSNASIFYFDTSALVKLVVVEDGSEMAAELWGSDHPAASSILAYPEGRAALAAARRLDRLGADEHRKALADFEELHADLATIGVDRELVVRAGEYAEGLGLRSYDAVHLATAAELGDDEVVVVTWDRDLARAAEEVGLSLGGSGGDPN